MEPYVKQLIFIRIFWVPDPVQDSYVHITKVNQTILTVSEHKTTFLASKISRDNPNEESSLTAFPPFSVDF